MVVGASGSFADRKSRHTRVPARLPKRARASSSASADGSSPPPPAPKIAPTSVATATESRGFQSVGPCGWPMAAYSAGILKGSSRASSMYWSIPST